MKWINYHHLIYFKEIAKEGSISKASKTLMVGQPALSTQLKSLEDYLGIELFERKNRKLILTEAGKVTYEYAKKISHLGQELIQTIDKKEIDQRVQLKVGVVDAIPKHLVCYILDFAHKKTGCFLTILEGDPIYLLRELQNHQLDVLITDQDLISHGDQSIYSKKIIRSKVSAYGGNAFSHLKKKFPQSLQGQPVILPTHHSRMLSDLEHYFNLKKIYIDRIAETQDSMLQKILATKGDGVIFLPDIAANELVKEKKLVKLGTLQSVYVDFYLIYSKRIINNPVVDLLVNQTFSSKNLS